MIFLSVSLKQSMPTRGCESTGENRCCEVKVRCFVVLRARPLPVAGNAVKKDLIDFEFFQLTTTSSRRRTFFQENQIAPNDWMIVNF